MKSQLLKVPTKPNSSFSIRRDCLPNINSRLHYHPEVELIHFNRGGGKQFVGDSISRFDAGDLILIGSNLVHYWSFDDVYFNKKNHLTTDIRVAHFCENFWGNHFLNLPENIPIKNILDKAKRGLQVRGEMKNEITCLLEQALYCEGPKRIVLLIEILRLISKSDYVALSSAAYVPFHEINSQDNSDRLNRIYEFSYAYFREKISLKEIAEVAHMSENSFCRYFKSQTGKTYVQFLIELRVGHACKLLIENKMCIKEIYYESGFNNTTSFHKYFKNITGKSPLNYQKQYLLKTV